MFPSVRRNNFVEIFVLKLPEINWISLPKIYLVLILSAGLMPSGYLLLTERYVRVENLKRPFGKSKFYIFHTIVIYSIIYDHIIFYVRDEKI